MKILFPALLLCGLLYPGAVLAAYEDEGLPEAAVSTDTVRNGDEDEGQAVIQENDEDLTAFVTDYIRKDIQLKGAFFLEEKSSRRLLKLSLASVEQKAVAAESGVKLVSAVFKDAAGKKYPAVFYLQNGPWGGLDIFKIELKAAPGKTAPAKK